MNKPADLSPKILKLLEADGRMSNTEISRRLNVSEAVVRQRLRRIFDTSNTRRGVVVNFSVLGIGTVSCLRVKFNAGDVDAAARMLADVPSTSLVMTTTGPFNLFLIIATHDPVELTKVIDEKIRPLKGFVGVDVSVISEAMKYDARYAPKLS